MGVQLRRGIIAMDDTIAAQWCASWPKDVNPLCGPGGAGPGRSGVCACLVAVVRAEVDRVAGGRKQPLGRLEEVHQFSPDPPVSFREGRRSGCLRDRASGCKTFAGVPGISTAGLFLGPSPAGGQVEAGGGGPQVASNRFVNAAAQGQVAGRCRCRRRALFTTRAATWIRRRRMVAVVALARPTPAMLAAARVRLNAMAAKVVQAALAVNFPEVIWSTRGAVHDVHDEGWVLSGARRGCGYLP